MSTGHANSIKDMLSRLETMVLMAAPLPLEAIRKQIASSIDIMIYLSRFRDGSRRVVEIAEILDYREGDIVLNPLFRFTVEGEDSRKRVLGALNPTGNKLENTVKLQHNLSE